MGVGWGLFAREPWGRRARAAAAQGGSSPVSNIKGALYLVE